MKKILLIPFLFLYLPSFCQSDSSSVKISVNVQARDCEYIATFTLFESRYEDIDSVMKARFRVTNPPSGATNVSIDSVKLRHWLALLERLRMDNVAVDQGIFNRIKASLIASANAWLVNKINRQDSTYQDMQAASREVGRRRLRKENTD